MTVAAVLTVGGLRHGIITPFAPRVATEQSFYGKPDAGQSTVVLQSVNPVLGLTWRKSASPAEPWTQCELISTDGHD